MTGSILKFGFLIACLISLPLTANSNAQEADKAKESSAAKLTLLEAGKPPLQKLRFAPKVGDKSHKVMKMKMRQAIGDAEPQEMPEQQMFMTIEVKQVSANGDIDFDFTYTDIKVVTADGQPSLLATTIEKAVKPLVGTGGSVKVDSRGSNLGSEYKVPDSLSPTIKSVMEGMKDALKNISVPLPEEAVGVGAKWKIVQPLNANGMQLDQISESELTELNPKGFAMKIKITQDAKPQDVKNALLPEGTSLKLESLDTTGSGNSEVVFTELLPKKAGTQVRSKTSMNIVVGQRTQKLSTDLTFEMVLEDAPAPAK